jgi:hypothetical protein
VDFKTGTPKSRNYIEGKTKDSKGNYKRQLVFYQLLMDRHWGGRKKMVEGVLEFVQPTSAGKIRSEGYSITTEETQELEAVIYQVAEEITSLAFWDTTCEEQTCEYCALRALMTT